MGNGKLEMGNWKWESENGKWKRVEGIDVRECFSGKAVSASGLGVARNDFVLPCSEFVLAFP